MINFLYYIIILFLCSVIPANAIDKLQKCFGKSCFAWTKTDNRIEREDHSGGKEMMHKQAFDREQELKREGPAGSLGVWVLEERGTCSRLTIGA